MATRISSAPEVPYIKPTILAPPKEFFRQFLNLHHNRVLNEDFPHEKLLTVKYKGVANNFIVNAKGSLTFKEVAVKGSEPQKTEEKAATAGEVTLNTYFQGKSFATRFNSKGIMRLWTNWGNYHVGQPLEFITVLKADTAFQRVKAYVTAGYHGPNVDATTRLQVRHENNQPRFSVAEKVTVNQGSFWAGVYGDLDLATANITQYNALVGYNVNKNLHLYAEHLTVPPKKGDAHLYRLGKLALTGVYKDANYWGLGQVVYDLTKEAATFEGGVVYTVDSNTSLRAKVSHNADLTIGARYKLNKNVSLNVGTFATLKTPEKIVNKNRTVPIPFGVQVEFSF